MRENVDQLLNRAEDFLTKFMEKAKVLNVVFTLVFTVRLILMNPRPLRSMGKSGAKKTFHQYRRIKLGNI